jgi:septal ring factor EnvC (AmiA/AmiB activator)
VTGYLFHRLDAPFASRGQHIAPLRVVCADRARARARVSQEFFVVTNWTLVSRVAGGGVSQEAFVVTNRTLITLTLSLASQEELDAKRKDMNEQKEKEALLAAKVAAVEEKQLNVEETYSSLQDEADAKTRKLKKLFAKFQTVAETIQGIREEQQREREEMLDTARTLTRQVGSTSHARNPFNLNFFDSAQCLMVRRWRLIGYFPIL